MSLRRTKVCIATLVGTLTTASGALAQVTAEELATTASDPNIGKVHFALGVDLSNAYYFRGYLQNNEQTNTQFWMDTEFEVAQSGDTVWSANLGVWNAFDNGDTAEVSDSFTKNWYEADLYLGLAIKHNEWTGSATYVFYTSPAVAFGTVEELIFELGFDDSEYLGVWAMNPSLMLAIETDDAADDQDSGIFLGLGVEPSVDFDNTGFEHFGLSFPAELGLSLSDYYQNADGDDETFGYFQLGAVASFDLPLSFSYGDWVVSAGLHGLFLGDTPKEENDGGASEVIGTIGLSISY